MLQEKIQELLDTTQKAKEESAKILEVARDELSQHVEAKISQEGQKLQALIEHSLDARINAKDVQQSIDARVAGLVGQIVPNITANIQKALMQKVDITGIRKSVQTALKDKITQDAKALISQEVQEYLHTTGANIQEDLKSQQQEALNTALKDDMKAVLQTQEAQIQEKLEGLTQSLSDQVDRVLKTQVQALKTSTQEMAKKQVKAIASQEVQDFLQTTGAQIKEDLQTAQEQALKSALDQNRQEALEQSQEQVAKLTQGLEQKANKALSTQIQALSVHAQTATSRALNMDFAKVLKDIFKQQIKSQLLKDHFKQILDEIFSDATHLRKLREMECEGQMYLASLIQLNAVKMLQQEINIALGKSKHHTYKGQ
ncbi:hypothetical protein [Helicobacter ailurogastricus]|uniref:hypothetical protein n=1 Tax=Helicobacter ailurogastricus TaxID=1578720 RepID=UPI000CF1AF45|nr:hypothetical protein [Helicobacter ailurogastricus]